MIWKLPISLEGLNQLSSGTIAETLGIEITDFGDDYITATMPVDRRTIQPFGLLHGGASVVLAETLGSVASTFCISPDMKSMAVGVEVNANHLRGVREGKITGKVSPIRIGQKIHVWQIELFDEKNRKTCISRLTTMIIPIQ